MIQDHLLTALSTCLLNYNHIGNCPNSVVFQFHYSQPTSYKDSYFSDSGIAIEAELITAKVPILKFKNRETGFEIDLKCNNVVGIQNTRLLYCYT
jgi:DNA polymerase sigma